jgi:nitroreductase
VETLKAIMERRSCRVYQDRPVSEETVEALLKAGMVAPSAMNSQPWEFLVMQDAEKKAAASQLVSYWSMLKKAPLGILVMANTNGYRASTEEFFIQDCAICSENILLAAQAMGLGGVYLGLYPKQLIMEKMRAIYGIPEHILPFAVLSIGYPDKPAHPHTNFPMHKVHRDAY